MNQNSPELDMDRLPRHIAIIMDGNGRWAKQHGLEIAMGHRTGTESLREIIRNASDIGIGSLSLYAFSTENWGRPASEVEALMQIMLDFFHSEIDELCEKNVHITILGEKDGLPPKQREALYAAEERTRGNTGLHLNLAINYGGRAELIRAAKNMAKKLPPEEFTEAALERELYTVGQPDVDLLIRTSGEMRLSNFLPWQTGYAEFIFPEILWPDFTVEKFHECIAAFQNRNRRFGKR